MSEFIPPQDAIVEEETKQEIDLCGLHVFADQGVGFNAKDPYGLYHPDCIMK